MSSDDKFCKFYLNLDSNFGFLEFPDGSFDLIANEMTVEKMVPMFPCTSVYRSEN
jgi:hypothetical protein